MFTKHDHVRTLLLNLFSSSAYCLWSCYGGSPKIILIDQKNQPFMLCSPKLAIGNNWKYVCRNWQTPVSISFGIVFSFHNFSLADKVSFYIKKVNQLTHSWRDHNCRVSNFKKVLIVKSLKIIVWSGKKEKRRKFLLKAAVDGIEW